MYYVYVLQSKSDDNKFYLGSSKDLKQRLKSHNKAKTKQPKEASGNWFTTKLTSP